MSGYAWAVGGWARSSIYLIFFISDTETASCLLFFHSGQHIATSFLCISQPPWQLVWPGPNLLPWSICRSDRSHFWAQPRKPPDSLLHGLFPLCYALSHSAVSDSLQPYGLQPATVLCPGDFPGKNTGVGCHCLLQGIFPTQGSNLHLQRLPHWQADSLPLSHLGSPLFTELERWWWQPRWTSKLRAEDSKTTISLGAQNARVGQQSHPTTSLETSATHSPSPKNG